MAFSMTKALTVVSVNPAYCGRLVTTHMTKALGSVRKPCTLWAAGYPSPELSSIQSELVMTSSMHICEEVAQGRFDHSFDRGEFGLIVGNSSAHSALVAFAL